jgi:replicative DNA helicase
MSSLPVDFSIAPPPRVDPYADRRPPFSQDAEQAVLGAMLLDQDAILRAGEHVDDTMFYREGHRRIFRAVLALSERGEVAEPLTLAEELARRGELEASGGKEYIAYLIDAVPTAANVEYHAKIVREKAVLRRLIEVSTAVVTDAFEGRKLAAELLDEAEGKIFQIGQAQGGASFTRIKELLWPAMERIEAQSKAGNAVTGIASGFRDLDEMTSGFQPSDLVIVAARPSMGKCVTADTRIVCSDGIERTIEEIYCAGGGELLTLGDDLRLRLTRPSAGLNDGRKPAFRVVTKSGREVVTTITHPFRAFAGWRPLAELAVGDHIAVPRVIPIFGTRRIRDCEAKLLGYLLGDGGLTTSPVSFVNDDLRVRDDYSAALRDYGGVAPVIYQPSYTTAVRVCATSETAVATRRRTNPLTNWLRELGLHGKKSPEKIIPDVVFSVPRDQLALFLNRLFATDGWASLLASGQPQIGFATASATLARQVQHLLLRFGVLSSKRRRMVRYGEERRTAWQLDITGAESIERFGREIGIFGKEAELGRVVGAVAARTRRGANRDLIPVAVWGEIERHKGVESWASLARRAGIRGWTNVHVGQRALTRTRLAAFASALGNERLSALATSDVLWDEIVEIEPLGERQVYDLTIPDTHNFVANDVCVHNTAFTLNIAQHVAITEQKAVAFFSLEMSKDSLVQRMLTSEARIDAQTLRKGRLRDDDFPRLARAAGILSHAPVFIDDTPGITVLEMRSKARRLKSDHGLDLVIVDYLQLMSGPSAENRQQEVSQISRGLKALAKELQVPVVALSQLSRAVDQRAGAERGRPVLSDLRESGAIEQDADLIMFLFREEVYAERENGQLKDPAVEGKAEVIIGKQRNGPIGTVPLFFHKQYTRFESLAKREYQGGE